MPAATRWGSGEITGAPDGGRAAAGRSGDTAKPPHTSLLHPLQPAPCRPAARRAGLASLLAVRRHVAPGRPRPARPALCSPRPDLDPAAQPRGRRPRSAAPARPRPGSPHPAKPRPAGDRGLSAPPPRRQKPSECTDTPCAFVVQGVGSLQRRGAGDLTSHTGRGPPEHEGSRRPGGRAPGGRPEGEGPVAGRCPFTAGRTHRLDQPVLARW